MKKYLYSLTVAALFLVGFSVLLYPAVSAYINEKHASHLVAGYNDKVENATDEELDRLFEEAAAYNKTLRETSGSFYHPQSVEGYRDVLDITGTGIMGYITIPKIKVELPVYHGIDEGVLQIGAGHLEGSDLPIGGVSVHSVLSGHRGLPSAKLFTNLNKLDKGDRFIITILNRTLNYEVDQIKIVKPTESDDLLRIAGEDHCTLLTCTPYGINSHRLLVRGIRVDDPETAKPGIYVPNEAFRIHTLLAASVAGVPIMLLFMLLLFCRYCRNKRTAKKENAAQNKAETLQ
ncbi:MAG: class C sortase [Oscillospiraceae bacterium]|nr:class C sortase [Oscillospiraceae bacterium]